MDGERGPMGRLERKGHSEAVLQAMGQMIAHLGQHPTYLGWVRLTDRDYGFVSSNAPKASTVRANVGAQGESRSLHFRPMPCRSATV